jgi:spore coat polysaccharide biosynthesis protein SpsF
VKKAGFKQSSDRAIKKRVVAVIQARMGSTRLPGKVLRPIAGKPLLWHIVHRLRHCSLIEDIAIATSTNSRDDAIVEFGASEDISVVRGPEDDVLARFARAAEALDADIIVRVSSDAPFIDAGFVDHLVGALIEQDGDYVLMQEGAACAHEGVDPFSRRGLDKLVMDAGNDPVAREHVSGYFKLNPDFVKIVRAAAYPALAKKSARLTIDTPDDLAFVEAVHARMAVKAGEASLADLLLLLEREPDLARINAHVKQKPIQPSGGLALIRCDGGGHFGFGHVKRMVALARALRDRQGIGAVFAVNGTVDALSPVRRAGFECQLLTSQNHLEELVTRLKPQILILDGREGPSRGELDALSRRVPVSAVIDDGSERRLATDFAYYPPVPQIRNLDWTGARTVPRVGWEWSLLGLNPHLTPARALTSRPTLLVAMGGSDPYGLTLRAARALTALDVSLRVRFVIGSGMQDARKTAAAIVALSPNYETVEGADDLSVEYAHADLALCAFGVTAYELAAFGVPALYLSLTPDHAVSARAFDDAGMGALLGLADKVSDEDLLQGLTALLHDAPRRRQMRKTGLGLIDGEGASRIAADLAHALKEEMEPLSSSGEKRLRSFS